MKAYFNLMLLISLILISATTQAQEHEIYGLEKSLMQGDKAALYEIANYLDNDNTITEYLGYHVLNPKLSEVAKRIIIENCMFLGSEIKIDYVITKKQFVDFLEHNGAKIKYSEYADAFIITPFNEREISYEVIYLTGYKRNLLLHKRKELLSLDWVKNSGIDELVNKKDPYALKMIAALLLKGRTRFDRYQWNADEYIELIQLLTNTTIAVPDENDKLSYHIDEDYYPASRINLLVFFSKNFRDYKWSDNDSIFVNPKIKTSSIPEERSYFELLSNKNDSVAIDAFIALTTLDPKNVAEIADEYENTLIDKNYSLPTFPYKFLKQIVQLTNYCEKENIDFKGTTHLIKNIQSLKTKEYFSERYHFENQLLNEFTLNEITAFEYWSMIYENNWYLTYSAGRILDIFYSKHWKEIVNSPEQLKLYLKKSALFNRLGIIGICNNYLMKFRNSPVSVIEQLKKIKTDDADINGQISKIMESNKQKYVWLKKDFETWEGSKDTAVMDISNKIKKIIGDINDTLTTRYKLDELIAQISYNQIDTAINGIRNIQLDQYWDKYGFLEDDFGFVLGSTKNDSVIEFFLDKYSKMDEYQMYVQNLDEIGIDLKKQDQSLDFDKIYEMLKYDVVTAFVGGGGGKMDNHVYCLIKLLELTFKTTLGYPKKLCNSRNLFSCNASKRAWNWMNYIEENNLLKMKHEEPISFTYGIN